MGGATNNNRGPGACIGSKKFLGFNKLFQKLSKRRSKILAPLRTEMSEFSYDQVPYPSFTFPQTSPDRLATMAILFGLRPPAPADCRVLEIGCGDGANLLSLAFSLPESKFVGIDLSAVHIRSAEKSSVDLALPNISFFQLDLIDFDFESFGKFDYVIAHGLFSWIPAAVRSKLLYIFSGVLAPNGVGYISYNTFPGSHARRIVWDMMRYGAALETDPLKKVEKGREILSVLTESMPADNVFKTLMSHELASILGRNPENVLHDDFSDVNEPFYFHQFVEMIAPFGLRYITDANPISLGDGNLSPEASRMLDSLTDDPIRREQYLDFVEFARFRSSLVCLADQIPDKSSAVAAIRSLLIASHVTPLSADPDLAGAASESFQGSKGGAFDLNHPLTKAALAFLRNIWPQSASFAELLEGSAKLLGVVPDAFDPADVLRMQTFLFELFRNGFIRMQAQRYEFVSGVSERPEVSRFARWQIQRGFQSVTTFAGVNVEPEFPAVRQMMVLLDGTRDRTDLLKELQERIAVPFSEREAFHQYLPTMIEENLAKMAEWGLLVK